MNELSFKCKWVLLLLALSGCVHRFELSPKTTANIEQMVTGKRFWLKQSLYAGSFYDDDRYLLLHPSPFDELTYLRMPDGETVFPPKEKMIIPIGTHVTITQIEWPTTSNVLNRPLLTPRGLPWIKMKMAMDRGNVSLMRDETFIMLVPIERDSQQDFNAWFSALFSEEDSNRWLLSQSESVKKAVLNKQPTLGMSQEALVAALGEPLKLSKESVVENDKQLTREVATYGKKVITLANGVVTDIQARTPSTPAQFQSVIGKSKG